ncbi:hypothetical protein ACVIHF_008812 [Bradyrhizobium sp. USDA 4506]
MKQSFVSLPFPLRYSLASGSVVEAWVSLECFWPWKSASALRPPPGAGGSPEPSFGLTLFIEAQASISVPSTEKWIARQKPLHPGLRQHRREELGRDVAFQQPVAVLREHRMVPSCIVDADSDEPAEQQIIFQPLHQKPLRADRIKRLQQHSPRQLLRRNRRPPNRRIKRGELAFQHRQRLVHDRPDRSQRMITPHSCFQIDVAEQLARPIVVAAHAPSPNLVGANESWSQVAGERLFQQPARSLASPTTPRLTEEQRPARLS